MKKIHSVFVFVFLSLLATIPVSTLAQEQTQLKEVAYHPFVKEGKVWNCQTIKRQSESGSVYALYQVTTNFSLYIDGDTVIGGQSYKKVYETVKTVDKQLLYTSPAEAAQGMEEVVHQDVNTTTLHRLFLREADKKVYALNTRPSSGADATEYLLYDFSLAAGDKVPSEFPIAGTFINSVDTIAAQGRYYRRYHLGPREYGGYEPLWVEGVGHPGCPFNSISIMTNDGAVYILQSCYEDGECIFTYDDFNQPGLTAGIGPLLTTVPEATGAVYDLQGRRLAAPPKKGVYIENGRKKIK